MNFILLSIILKNLKIILRSPLTLLLLILAPILLMLIVGITYSGNILSNTNVGMIEYEDDFFQFNDINFIKYNKGNLDSSRTNCINDLKKGNVEICVYFKPYRDKFNQLISAKVDYYIDVTRPQISDILYRNFNLFIDEKTNEISQKTVTDIFSEVKDTVDFMERSKSLLDGIENNLTVSRKNLEDFQVILSQSQTEYEKSYSQLLFLENELKTQINSFKSSKSSLIDDLESLNANLGYLQNEADEGGDNLNYILGGIQAFGEINPLIYDYVNVGDLEDSIDIFDDIYGDLGSTKFMINNLLVDLKIGDTSFDDLIDSIGTSVKLADEVGDNLYLANGGVRDLLVTVKEKESQINIANEEFTSKLEYFKDLSNKDASQITQPISKNAIPIFKNFKRVHQLAPTVVVLVLLFIGLLLSNVIVSMEVNSKAYFRNLLSPIHQKIFIVGLFFTSLIIVLFQILFLLIILQINFSIPIFGNAGGVDFTPFLSLIIIIVHLLVIFILLGMFFGYAITSNQVSILVTTFVMLFMFLLSNIIVPIEIMPEGIGNIISLSPVVIGEDLVRQVFFFKNYSFSFEKFGIFYIYSLLLFLLVLWSANRRKSKVF